MWKNTFLIKTLVFLPLALYIMANFCQIYGSAIFLPSLLCRKTYMTRDGRGRAALGNVSRAKQQETRNILRFSDSVSLVLEAAREIRVTNVGDMKNSDFDTLILIFLSCWFGKLRFRPSKPILAPFSCSKASAHQPIEQTRAVAAFYCRLDENNDIEQAFPRKLWEQDQILFSWNMIFFVCVSLAHTGDKT